MKGRAVHVHVVLLALALGAASLPLPSAGAGPDDEGEALLAYARRVASNETFAGVVEVRWRDDEGREHVERVGARSVAGSFVVGIGDRRVVGQGVQRSTTEGGQAGAHWSTADLHPAPRPGAAWQLEVVGARAVAERAATLVVARDADGRVRARFAVDHETGQLLKREVLDQHGHVLRSVGFVKIVTGAVTPAVPAVKRDITATPVPISEVPGGFTSPEVVGSAYRLLGRYRHPHGVVQLYYGDGLFTLSLFEQQGRIDWSALPAGHPADVAGVRTRSYSTATGTVVVWSNHDLVLTAIGDGPPDTVLAVVASVNGRSNDHGWVDDVTNFVLGPFRWE